MNERGEGKRRKETKEQKFAAAAKRAMDAWAEGADLEMMEIDSGIAKMHSDATARYGHES